MDKAYKARQLRYKRPALATLGYAEITDELYNIQSECADVRYFFDDDRETLLNALDGDEEQEYEFRMMFSDLSARADQLSYTVHDHFLDADTFDDCTVGLIGNRYQSVGYDDYEEDYYSLCGYEQNLAFTEAGKRFMRLTKVEMLSTIGQCLGIVIAFLDIRQKYDYLKAAFDILKDENTSYLQIIKQIDEAYETAAKDEFYPSGSCKALDTLVASLPDRAWLE